MKESKLTKSCVFALLAAVFLTGLSLPCRAELPALIPREILFSNPVKTSPQLSPDGTLIAYLAPDSNGILNVWLQTIGMKDDRVITSDQKRGVRNYIWQADGKHILFAQDEDGDENWHIYQTEITSKVTRDLTPFLGVKANLVQVNPNYPYEILVSMNVRDKKRFDVYHADLRTGALELLCENPGDIQDWTCDNDLEIRAATAASKDGGYEIRLKDKSNSSWRVLGKYGPDEEPGQIQGFTADNKSMWLSSSLGANAIRLMKVDLASGKEETVAADKQFDVSAALIDKHTHELEAVVFEKERDEWLVIDNSFKNDMATLQKLHSGSLSFISEDKKGEKWIVAFDAADSAGSLFYLYDRPTKMASYLFCSRPALEKFQLAKMEPVTITARDGMKIYGYLTLPPGIDPKNLPLVLTVHGGPWSRETWGFDRTAQWLANRGCAVLNVNFRGSTGYGKDYLNAGDREWAAKMQSDLLDAKDWAINQGYVDPKRTCIYGGSYGGYATLVAAAFTPDEFACGVDLFGPSNLVTLLDAIPPYWETMKTMFAKRLGDPQRDKEFLESRSPLFKAAEIKMPLLIIQGAKDPRVKQAESDQIVAAIRKNNRHVEYMVFPDEGHGLQRPENNVKYRAKMEAFLAKYMGTRLETANSAEESSNLMQ